ncbi:hypothetical protein [Sphingomonas sp. R1]|uniref:hypothetical protein n=1 Tax=Sphingomonas sp. R1 TaxID=399176 RepID=UPI002224901E|nr:hypothetical protein [Sphingomonas sp. R1]UYY76300.1 hypothetical protein OIM94_12310 [Sphingomonas sp. R1]
MKILFYLPVMTPWWFDQVFEPLIRRVAAVAEVHVLAPAPWQNTGIGADQLERCADLDGVQWSIVDDADHPSLRTVPADPEGLVAFVAAIAPDLVLCRSADVDTPRRFPGVVRHIMEAVLTPFDLGDRPNTIFLPESPFANGAMPELTAQQAAQIDALITPCWDDMQAHWRAAIPDRATVFGAFDLPLDRPAILLPLEYAHAENFYLQHRPGGLDDEALVRQAAESVAAAGMTLVVTDHPLNSLYVERQPLYDAIHALDGPVLADPAALGQSATTALLAHVDGVLLGDSKTFATAAAFGTPMYRATRFESAPWLHMETDLFRFLAAVSAGTAARPDAALVRRWFGYHYANEAFHPTDPALTGARVIAHALRPLDPSRWEVGLGLLARPAGSEELAA